MINSCVDVNNLVNLSKPHDLHLKMGLKINTTQTLCKWKQPKYPSMDEWINKMWYIGRTMECYLALRRNKIPIHATTWIHLEKIMLSGVNWTQEYKHCMIALG